MKTDFLVIGFRRRGPFVRAESRSPRTRYDRHQGRDRRVQHQLCTRRHLLGNVRSRHIRETHPRHAGLRRRQMRREGRGTGRAAGPELIADLIAWGTRFDKTPDGRFELNREGGHSEHRILHHEDLTGAEIERALVQSVREHPNITVLERHFAIDLLTQHHLGEFVTRHTRGLASFGAYVLNLDTNEIETMLSKFTVVATGGCVATSTPRPQTPWSPRATASPCATAPRR